MPIWTSRTGPVLDIYGEAHSIGLQYEDLAGYDFTDADLRFADLYGANLQSATLTRANLDGSYIFGANLDFAIYEQNILINVRKCKNPNAQENMCFNE